MASSTSKSQSQPQTGITPPDPTQISHLPHPHPQNTKPQRPQANALHIFVLVDLSSLPLAQLNQVKNQLTQELQHLTTSFQQLKTAQAKFRDCITSVREGLSRKEGTAGEKERAP